MNFPSDESEPQHSPLAMLKSSMKMEAFSLPSEVMPLITKPCSAKALSAKIQTHLKWMSHSNTGNTAASKEIIKSIRLDDAKSALIELWNWIWRHAASGDLEAQRIAFDSIFNLTASFIPLAKLKLPSMELRIKESNLIPGFVSVDKDIQSDMETLCRELGQGTLFPFPLQPPGKKSLKQKGKLSTAQHDLVNLRLYPYIEKHRRRNTRSAFYGDLTLAKGGTKDDLPPLLDSMLKLPPLSLETWKLWRDVGRQVIEDHTNGNPAAHSVFKTGGYYASLGMPDPRAKRQEIVLWKRLGEAWKFLAENMKALPADSPHHKDFSRR